MPIVKLAPVPTASVIASEPVYRGPPSANAIHTNHNGIIRLRLQLRRKRECMMLYAEANQPTRATTIT